jgi:polysaccharide deacetylase family protein (PEP-CTERM system associated)
LLNSSPMNRTEHLFTVDVEDYFQVNAFEGSVQRSEWDQFPSRVERNTEVLLELLQRKGTLGTFFTLGWVANKCPQLVRRIAAAGHEIASHGWWHRKVTDLTREEFREEAHSSRAILEDVSGQPVLGFRAPSFSIVRGREWAFDVLLEVGYRYDSSLFPIRRPDYGYPGAEPVPHLIHRPAGTLLELPPATTVVAGVRMPAGGGGYFRQLPYALFRRAFDRLEASRVSGMFYIHPWEVDVEQPRIPVPPLARLRHYTGLARTLPRLERLLDEFRFTSVARRFKLGSSLPGDAAWASLLSV